MRKLLFAISAFALLTGLSTSCQKDIDPLQESNQNTEFTITATIADNDTKVSYVEDGSNLKPTWQVDDIIIGFDDATYTNTYGFKVTAVNDGKATLAIITEGNYAGSKKTNPDNGTKMYMIYAPGKKPGDISSKSLTVSLASQSKDVVPALMMASATVSGSSLSLAFTNKTAIIAIKNPTMAAASTSYTSIALSGTGVNTEVVFNLDGSSNLQASYQTAGTITKKVEFTSDATTKKGAEITYIVACPLSTAADLTFTASNGEKFSKASKTMSAGNYYYMTPTFAPGLPEGALSGLFSVSATTKVHFSKGNLQATYSTSSTSYTWGFASNQYEYIGNAAGNTTIGSQTNGAIVDLFGWVGANSSLPAYGISTSNTDSDYGNVASEALKADWGTAIDNKGTWRTLTKEEWNYLLSRTVNEGTGEGKSYQRATIRSDVSGGVYGLIIYPDNYTAQTTETTYTSAQWTAMESSGCVFLPAAGMRNGSAINQYSSYGYYWSSTAYENKTYAYRLNFYSSNSGSVGSGNRHYGYSVRLVSAAQ